MLLLRRGGVVAALARMLEVSGIVRPGFCAPDTQVQLLLMLLLPQPGQLRLLGWTVAWIGVQGGGGVLLVTGLWGPPGYLQISWSIGVALLAYASVWRRGGGTDAVDVRGRCIGL